MATLMVDKVAAAEEAKARAMDAVEEAKRAIVRGKRQFEDLRDDAAHRIKKAPLMSVGIGIGAGLMLGTIVGVIAGKTAAKPKASSCC